MALLLADALVTAPIILPFRLGWVESADIAYHGPNLAAADVGPDDFALLPAVAMTGLVETHQIDQRVGVSHDGVSAIAMRTPVRPDGIDRTPVALLDATATAATLARATLWSFYGIRATRWTTGPDAGAQVAIVEGVDALTSPEAGISEDLGRAWRILTELPLVSYALAVPNNASHDAVAARLGELAAALTLANDRRRRIRRVVSEEHEIEGDLVARLYQHQRQELTDRDRVSLAALITRGGGADGKPVSAKLPWREQGTSLEAPETVPPPPDDP